MRNIILLLSILILGFSANSQSRNDSILANERKIDRPLALHKGQMQINAAYEISILSKEYDNDGKKIDLAKRGTAGVLHKYLLEFNYGILSFLQASVALDFAKRGERKENVYIDPGNGEPYISINYFDDYKGFSDLYLGTVIKLPLKSKKFELAISPGLYLPVFDNEPKEPEHSATLATVDLPINQFYYHTNHKMANGATAFKVGGSTIIRPGKNFSLSAQISYTAPLSESESIFWIHQLNGSTFEYQKVPYKYLISNNLDYKLGMGFQAISWFYVSLDYVSMNKSNGWSEISGSRIGNLKTKLSSLMLSYEIQVTGKLWLNQCITYPVFGKNIMAPFSIYTGLSYNFYPIKSKSNIVSID